MNKIYKFEEKINKNEVSEVGAEAYKQLCTSKAARKQAEINQRTLANRLKMLHYEDEKILKKIEHSKFQSKKIFEIKFRNESQQRKREEMKQEKEKEIKRLQELNRMIRENLKVKITEKKGELLQRKKLLTYTVKNDKQKNKEYVQTLKNSLMEKYMALRHSVKSQELRAIEIKNKAFVC